jgi:NarL family two-component system response regulator YdfI
VVRVLVWAKSPFMQAGLEAAVCADGRFEIVGENKRVRDLVSAFRDFQPDVALLDASEGGVLRILAGISGLPLIPPLVVLTGSVNRSELLSLLQSRVRAILHSDSSPSEIGDALKAASNGLTVISPELLEILLPASELADAEPLFLQDSLTSRESEVLALLAEGAGNKEIAAKLGISEHTAKFHVSSILNKLGANTRTEAVTRGYRLGLILI